MYGSDGPNGISFSDLNSEVLSEAFRSISIKLDKLGIVKSSTDDYIANSFKEIIVDCKGDRKWRKSQMEDYIVISILI